MSFEKFVSLSWSDRIDWISRTWGETETPVSPTERIDVVVDYDSDGWEVWETFFFGEIVLFSPWKDSGPKLYRIVGFLKDDSVLLRPHGLGHDPLYAGFTVRPEGLTKPEPVTVSSHKDGLVVFG